MGLRGVVKNAFFSAGKRIFPSVSDVGIRSVSGGGFVSFG